MPLFFNSECTSLKMPGHAGVYSGGGARLLARKWRDTKMFRSSGNAPTNKRQRRRFFVKRARTAAYFLRRRGRARYVQLGRGMSNAAALISAMGERSESNGPREAGAFHRPRKNRGKSVVNNRSVVVPYRSSGCSSECNFAYKRRKKTHYTRIKINDTWFELADRGGEDRRKSKRRWKTASTNEKKNRNSLTPRQGEMR